jgi:DNA-binding HxlR family transcriptional regulator
MSAPEDSQTEAAGLFSAHNQDVRQSVPIVRSWRGDGPKRFFNEIKRMVGGISQRMLTFSLRGLERGGLVTRTLYPTTPPRVEYELTKFGGTLWRAIEPLASWARNRQFGKDGRLRCARSRRYHQIRWRAGLGRVWTALRWQGFV